MSIRGVCQRAAIIAAIVVENFAAASEPGHYAGLKIAIIPRKAASARDRAKAKKPYYRLGLLAEMGVPISRPAAKKVD
jgi:hypothetical protein